MSQYTEIKLHRGSKTNPSASVCARVSPTNWVISYLDGSFYYSSGIVETVFWSHQPRILCFTLMSPYGLASLVDSRNNSIFSNLLRVYVQKMYNSVTTSKAFWLLSFKSGLLLAWAIEMAYLDIKSSTAVRNINY